MIDFGQSIHDERPLLDQGHETAIRRLTRGFTNIHEFKFGSPKHSTEILTSGMEGSDQYLEKSDPTSRHKPAWQSSVIGIIYAC